MEVNQAIYLLIIAVGVFLIPIFSGFIGLPAVVGEVFFGIIIVTIYPGILYNNPWIEFLREFGFLFLMYLAGMEIDFQKIRNEGARGNFLSFLVVFLIFAISLFIIIKQELNPIYLLVLSAISIGILVVTLREADLLKGNFGQTLLTIGSTGEFVTLILLTFYTVYQASGISLPFFIRISEIALIFTASWMALSVIRVIVWWHPEKFKKLGESGNPTEIGIRGALVIMLGFSTLAAALRMEPIVGAFIAGAIISMVFYEKGVLEEKLSALGHGFLIPFFFIGVGLKFSLREFLDINLLTYVMQLSLVILVIRVVPSLLLVMKGISFIKSISSAFLLSAPFTLLVAIATVGLNSGGINEKEASAIILLAIFTTLFYPWIFKLLIKFDEAL